MNILANLLYYLTFVFNYIASFLSIFKEKEDLSYKNFDSKDLLEYVKKNKYHKLDFDDENYNNIMKKIEINENNLSSFEINLSRKLHNNIQKFDYSKNNNNSLTKKFFIKSQIPKDKIISMEDHLRNQNKINPIDIIYQDINANNNLNENQIKQNEVNNNEYHIKYFGDVQNNLNEYIKLNTNEITIEEFNDSYRDNSSMDIYGICKKNLYDLSLYNKVQLIRIFNNILDDPKLISNNCFGKCSFVYKDAKKGPKDEVSSYRTVISMPNTIIYLNRIIALRLNKYLNDNKFIDTTIQKGGVSGLKLGIFEQIIKLKNTIKDANKNNNELCVMFIDIKDAFPSIPISIVCQVMKHYKVDDKIINYVKTYYDELHYYYDTPEWKSDLYKWNKGLLQGCPLSSLLFILVMNYILERINRDFQDQAYKFSKNDFKILLLAYIDDIAITTKDKQSMILVYEKLKESFEKFNLKINKDKTSYMHICPNFNNLQDPQTDIEQVISYTYLGERLYSNGESIETYNLLLITVKSLLYRIDSNVNYDNPKKLLYLNKIIIPKIQRKFYIMYDISNEMKEHLLKYVNMFVKKWNGNSDIVVNLGISKEKLDETTDQVLLNNELIDFNNEQNNIILNIENIKFEYSNLNEINLDIEDTQDIFE